MEKPLINRVQFYNAIAEELRHHDVSKIKVHMKTKYKTDKYDKLDLNQLEELLKFLQESR